jgi:hypothetical protein
VSGGRWVPRPRGARSVFEADAVGVAVNVGGDTLIVESPRRDTADASRVGLSAAYCSGLDESADL